ncbi:hypothetical protein ACFFRR_008429 [Megaselia abdita]
MKIDDAREQLKTFETSNDVLRNRLTVMEESTKKKNETFTKSFDKVESKLNKTKTDLEQREEEVLLHQQILKDRCELLENLQTKNKLNEDLISQLTNDLENKTKYLKLTEIEIEAKANEIQNLVTSLNQKQSELDNRDEILRSFNEQHDKNKQAQNTQSNRIEELESELFVANEKLLTFETALKVNENIEKSKRIEQLESDLYEANIKAETYEQVLKSINETRRLYLIEQRKKIKGKLNVL